jgi:pyruvate dehydrogenase E1 component alpha subunit
LADWCRQEQKPAFVDLKTYRYLGHSMSDPQKYRTKDEVDKFKERDSINVLASHLMNERRGRDGKPILSEEAFVQMQREVREVVRAAIEFAEQSPAPDASELYTDVLINPVEGMSPSGEYGEGETNPLL